jgi:hypothetical protein
MTKNFILLARDYARTAAVAFAVTVPLTQPASALDRLLMLGGVSLRPYLENTCTEVDKIDDVAVLEARRQRVLRLQAEAASEVKILQCKRYICGGLLQMLTAQRQRRRWIKRQRAWWPRSKMKRLSTNRLPFC